MSLAQRFERVNDPTTRDRMADRDQRSFTIAFTCCVMPFCMRQ